MLQFTLPPLPHYITGGEDTYCIGRTHPNRSNIGVFDFIFVTRGCLFITENEISYEITPGGYIIISPEGKHYSTFPCKEETHFYWVHFQTCGSYLNAEDTDSCELPPEMRPYEKINQFLMYLPVSATYPFADEVIQILKELIALNENISSTACLKQQQLFVDLLENLNKKTDTSKINRMYTIAEKAAEYIRQNSQENLRYDKLAGTLHFHENYIALCMKKTFGCTPLEYLTYFRLEKGKHMILHTDMPIGMISEKVGFSSVSYFVRCFTKKYGVSPKVYRQRYYG